MDLRNLLSIKPVRRMFLGRDINAIVGPDTLRILVDNPDNSPRSTNWKVHFKRALDSYPLLTSGIPKCMAANELALASATSNEEMIGCRLFQCLVAYSCQSATFEECLNALGSTLGMIEHSGGKALKSLEFPTATFYLKLMLLCEEYECVSDLCDAWLEKYPTEYPLLHLFKSIASWATLNDAEAIHHANLVSKMLRSEQSESLQVEMEFCNTYNLGVVDESCGRRMYAEQCYKRCLEIIGETPLRSNWEYIVNNSMYELLAPQWHRAKDAEGYAARAAELLQQEVEMREAIEARVAGSQQTAPQDESIVKALRKTKMSITPSPVARLYRAKR
jgi:hypothetical protein